MLVNQAPLTAVAIVFLLLWACISPGGVFTAFLE